MDEQRKVLIVEADFRKSDALASAVGMVANGAQIVRSHSVDGAVERVRRGDIVLVIVGPATTAALQLPQRLRGADVASLPGVVLVLPASLGHPGEQATRLGVDAILRLPLDLGQLRRLVSLWLPESDRPTPTESQAPIIAILRERIQHRRFQIPVSPAGLQQLETLASVDGTPDVKSLVEVLAVDPLLAACALRAANAAGEIAECRSLVAAVNRLGVANMLQELLNVARGNHFPVMHPPVREQMELEWRLACIASEQASAIVSELSLPGAASASLAALLANLGRLLVLSLLDRHFPAGALDTALIRRVLRSLALESTVEALRALHVSARTRAIIVGPIAAPDAVFHRDMLVVDVARWLARAETGIGITDPAQIVTACASAKRLGLAASQVEGLLARRIAAGHASG